MNIFVVLQDLNTPLERKLGEYVKKNHGTDFWVLDRYPTEVCTHMRVCMCMYAHLYVGAYGRNTGLCVFVCVCVCMDQNVAIVSKEHSSRKENLLNFRRAE